MQLYPHSKPGSQVFQQQVTHLYHHAPIYLGLTAIIACVLAYQQRSVISSQTVVIWLAGLLVVTVAEAVLVIAYHKAKPFGQSVVRWHNAFGLSAALVGFMWSSSAFFLFPDHSLENLLSVVFVLAGVTAVAIPALSASLKVFYAFATPILLTLIFRLYQFDTDLPLLLSIIGLLYLVALLWSAKTMNHRLANSFSMQFNNQKLIDKIKRQQAAEDELFQQKERLQITFSAMAEGVITTTEDGLIEYMNPAAENMTGWSCSEVKGKNAEMVFSHYDEHEDNYTHGAISICLGSSSQAKKTSRLSTRDQGNKVVDEVATPLKDRTGKIIGAVAIIRDITQASEHSRQLAHQASHDNLTGLPNRTLLADRLKHALNKGLRSNTLVAVLYMDLDRFKHVNDSLGHAAGDCLLRIVAERICVTVRQEDTVSRIGGDEFVVILEGLVMQGQANVVAQKIVENLALPVTIDNQEISTRVSIGITLFPRDGKDVETLLKNADTAMYNTKKLADTSIQFYTKQMSQHINNRLKLEQQVQKAIAQNQLELYYQPRVDIDSGLITGIEALVRWHATTDKPVSPAEFIHIAEETGSIIDIGKWVLETACQQAKSWIELRFHDLQISVNLSSRQILSDGLVKLVAGILKETDLSPERLELEITENLFHQNAEQAIKVLQDLKALGVKLTIDDFGSGYSSLAFINQFPVDIIKIDKSFIDDITSESADIPIVPAIIAMCHGLNLEVTAEGVESEIQRDHLNSLECDSFQGFIFSKPLPSRATTKLLIANRGKG